MCWAFDRRGEIDAMARCRKEERVAAVDDALAEIVAGVPRGLVVQPAAVMEQVPARKTAEVFLPR